MWIGASLRLLEDMTLPDPVNGISSHMVVHFNGFDGREIDPFRLFAEIRIDTWSYTQMANVPVYYSSGKEKITGWANKISSSCSPCRKIPTKFIFLIFKASGVMVAPSICILVDLYAINRNNDISLMYTIFPQSDFYISSLGICR
jgi:hypothetical protein